MHKNKEGSLVLLMIGLFWLLGIITAVLYALTAHIHTVMTLREQHAQCWQLLQGGMLTAVACINDNAKFYLQNQDALILYEGPWSIDPHHTMMRIHLSIYKPLNLPQHEMMLEGKLLQEGNKGLITVLWYLTYNEKDYRWHYRYAERLYQ